ncbi:hypothetical protein RCL1_000651 [Eukaryota sp. TZLM3-RCL]
MASQFPELSTSTFSDITHTVPTTLDIALKERLMKYPEHDQHRSAFTYARGGDLASTALRVVYGQARGAPQAVLTSVFKTFMCQLIEEAIELQIKSRQPLPLRPEFVILAREQLRHRKQGAFSMHKKRFFSR